MMTFIAYIIKIIFAIIATYCSVYFINNDSIKDKEKLYKELSILSLLGSSLIGFLYILSENIDNYLLYIFGILIFLKILFKNNKHSDLKINSLYFLNFVFIVMIATGYILYALIVILAYYFLNNNLLMSNKSEEEYDLLNKDNKDLG